MCNVHYVGNECLLKEGLSPECQLACVCAMSKLRYICEIVLSGKITVSDLSKISENKELMDRLCKAAEYEEFTATTVSEVLNQRLDEYLFLETRRHAYRSISNWIPDEHKFKGV